MKKVLLKIFISNLTSGKVYDIISTKDENYYSENFFRDLRVDELREEKLKELGL
jgi:hypothetical protein